MKRGTWISVGVTALVMVAASHISSMRGLANRISDTGASLSLPSFGGMTGSLAHIDPKVASLIAAVILLGGLGFVLARRRFGSAFPVRGLARSGEPLQVIARKRRISQDALRTDLVMSIRAPRARVQGTRAAIPPVRPPARKDLPGGMNRRAQGSGSWAPPVARSDSDPSRWISRRRAEPIGYDPCSLPPDPRTTPARGRR